MKEDRNMSDDAILGRYSKANATSILCMDRIVFESLMDIPRLIDERKILLTKIEELSMLLEESKE